MLKKLVVVVLLSHSYYYRFINQHSCTQTSLLVMVPTHPSIRPSKIQGRTPVLTNKEVGVEAPPRDACLKSTLCSKGKRDILCWVSLGKHKPTEFWQEANYKEESLYQSFFLLLEVSFLMSSSWCVLLKP